MSASPVTIPVNPLPLEIDVGVTISRPQTELASDLSLLCFATPGAPFPPNNDRVRVYSTFSGLIQDTEWNAANTGYWAAKAFFDQTPRPRRIAIGRVFENPVPAQIMAATITDLTPLKGISDGSFTLTVSDETDVPVVCNVEAVDFTTVLTMNDVANAIQAAIVAAGFETEISATIDYGNHLVISAIAPNTIISYAEAGISGTNISELLKLTQETGAATWKSYTPGDLASECGLIASAARMGGFPVFAWALDKKYRDTPAQRGVADWVESSNFKMASVLATNQATAYSSGDTTNIGFYTYNLAYKATAVVYASSQQYYPEIAYAMSTLATDYSLSNSVGTACFKDAVGIPPENITETQLSILAARNINVFVRVGNTARTMRYGTQSAPSWFTDSYYGAANFRQQIQVNIANGLYRRNKTPYDRRGQLLVQSDIERACGMYVRNGYLSEREVADPTTETGYTTFPPYLVTATPIYLATETQRASRDLVPFQVTAYEAGAIQHVNVFVDLIN